MRIATLFSRRHEARAEASALTRLAVPMMIAQMAQVATGFVDTVMAGQVSANDLAAVSIGSSILITVFITLSGVMVALNPVVAHHIGARAPEKIGPSVRQGIWLALALGLFGMAILFGVQPFLGAHLGLDAAVTDKVNGFLTGAGLGVPGVLLYRALHAYSSSVNRTKPIMIVSLCALALNIPLNYILIHGLFGFPELGGAGCGWATGAVFWFSFIALAIHTRLAAAYRPYRLWQRFERPDPAQQRQLLRIGAPVAFSYFLEVSAFTFVALAIAKLGAVTVSGHQVVINFSSLIYMIPQSLATALTVRVGQALGHQDPLAARFRSGVGMVVALLCACATSLCVLLLREPIAAMYSNDARVVALAASLLLFAAVFQLSDAAQTAAAGALRGYKVTARPMAVHLVAFWGVGLAGGAWLGLGHGVVLGLERPMGAHGFWLALTISLTLAAILLSWMLARVSHDALPAPGHLQKVSA
ncbi:MATE family efflux transporter [Microvirgula aerodenitrificans]|uniref:MATE family efflux transporter n=1 Tax=Microvirgula aerodenitrificans TaxID=57480 RepID=UPI0006884960|nr:MATE family efflux transporter [Microvirgula aerodenitrificans]